MRGELGRDGLQMGRRAGQNEGSLTELSISHSYSLCGPLGCRGGSSCGCTGLGGQGLHRCRRLEGKPRLVQGWNSVSTTNVPTTQNQ